MLTDEIKDGKKVSPVLPKGKTNYLIDIDGTVGEDIPNEEPERMIDAEVYPGAVEQINAWFDEGHIITFFTSRSSSEHKEITETWLKKHGFKYHHLLMDKPRGGNYHWIDNHKVTSSRYTNSWSELVVDLEVE